MSDRTFVDTNVLIWVLNDDRALTRRMRAVISSPTASLHISVVSAWEIAIKYALGKLPLPESPDRYVPRRMTASGSRGLSVEHAHALRVAELPMHHRDPFDRLLVAQAQIEKLTVVTVDPQFRAYDVQVRFAS